MSDNKNASDAQENVFGEPIAICSTRPMTGFFRNGCCDTGENDVGTHTVCAIVTQEFLEFSKSRGNDLSTPRPEYGFAGLNPGDRWCLCALRWKEAFDAGCAPKVILQATNIATVKLIPLQDLKSHAADLS
ncbi:MAG: DUF2237 domain-containing protein [Pseudomonadota bacterium]